MHLSSQTRQKACSPSSCQGWRGVVLDWALKLEPGEQEAEPEHHDRDEETEEDAEEAGQE